MSQDVSNPTSDAERLIMEYFPMVRRVATKMAQRYPSFIEIDDLVSIGTMGLIDAAHRYDRSRNATFASYALIRIKGAIVDELRKQDWVPRTVRARAREITEARHAVRRDHGRIASKLVAKKLGLDVDTLANRERNSQVLTQVSMWETRSDSDQTIADGLESPTSTPSEFSDRADLNRTIQRALANLSERERTIVRLYYYEDRSFREIGEILGVTESRISQLHSRVKRKLRDIFGQHP